MTTTKLGVATRLNQILVTSDLIVHSIACAKLDKAVHCLGGRAFHDYVHSTAQRVVLNDVGASAEEVNNLFSSDIVWNLQNK